MNTLGRSCTALGAAALYGIAQAQPLSDVVVSASRGEQRSFDAPAAVQAVGADTIREAGPQVNLSESVNRIPGVAVLNRQNYAQDLQLSIRGFGARSTFGIRGVRLIVDGIPATMPDGQGQASTISLGSAQRIEVLRGPLALLYGNAAGGVLQVFSRDGPAVPFAEATASFGSHGSRRYALQGGGQAGRVNWFADYSDFSTDGYREHGDTRRRHFNTKWRFDLSDDTRLTLVANLFDQPLSLDPLGLTRAQMEANPRQAVAAAFTQDTRKVVSQNQAGAVLEHRMDARNRVTGRVYLGQRDLFNKLSIPLAAQTPATAAGGIVDLDRNYYGAGLQYANESDPGIGRLRTVVGIDVDRMKDRRRGYLNTAGMQGALKRDENNLADSVGLYAQTTWLIDRNWSATAGLRSTRVRFQVDDFFAAPGNPDDSGSTTYRATNPVLGVTRHFGDSLNVYANWGRGFETPTFTELAYRPNASGLNFDLQASRSRHLEIGAKARLGDDHRLDAALYTIDTDNELVVDTNNGGRTTYRNGGRTERKGLELAYTGRVGPGLTAHLAITALRAEFQDGFSGGTGTVAAGNRLPGIPSRLVFGELAWRPAGTGAAAGGAAAGTAGGWLAGFSTALELIHAGSLQVNDTNSDSVAGYTVLNLRAGFAQTAGPWQFRQFVRIDNLSGRRYVGSVIVNDTNQRYFEPAPGRNWLVGVSVAYQFR